MFYRRLILPVLSRFDAEEIHDNIFRVLRLVFSIPGSKRAASWWYTVKNKKLERKIAGLKFANPVGLAAGFDKNGTLLDILPAFGFGFIEIGTVTPLPQAGNDKPRIFRLLGDKAIINRLGFNNDGVMTIATRLKNYQKNGTIIGGNIGKNKATSNENAVNDYLKCFEALYPMVDYFAVNISSPNTPNLRALQDKEPLAHLLFTLQERNNTKQNPKPIFLKIAPDLSEKQLDDIVEIVLATKLAGVIATNTTVGRDGLHTDRRTVEKLGEGGLSGRPLSDRSTEVIRYLAHHSHRAFAIIGVGGILTADDAMKKIKAGADLVQVYSGFIYEGPGMVKKINKAILKNFL